MADELDRKAPVTAVIHGDLNMLRCLAVGGIPTLVVASDPTEVTLRSRYCHDARIVASPSNPRLALCDFLKLGRSFAERPVLFYGDDAMLLFLSRYRSDLGQAFRFQLPSAELVEATVDKGLFADLADRHALPVPRTWRSEELRTAAELLHVARLPCIIKPRQHGAWMSARAARGEAPLKALRAETFGDLTVALDRARRYGVPFIVQEYISGNEDCLYSYHAYRDGAGCVLGSYVGRKIRTYPRDGGVSTYLELVKEPHIAELGERILANVGLVGPVALDFKRDARTGEIYLLEVNARFTLWNYLGTACGVNLPEIAYHDLIGERRPAISDYRTGVRWLSFGNDLRGFMREYRRSGALSWSDWLGTYRGKLVYDVFSWRDPMPFAASVWSYTRALATKFGHAALLSGGQ